MHVQCVHWAVQTAQSAILDLARRRASAACPKLSAIPCPASGPPCSEKSLSHINCVLPNPRCSARANACRPSLPMRLAKGSANVCNYYGTTTYTRKALLMEVGSLETVMVMCRLPLRLKSAPGDQNPTACVLVACMQPSLQTSSSAGLHSPCTATVNTYEKVKRKSYQEAASSRWRAKHTVLVHSRVRCGCETV
jgi:hypothetical protein